jgi:hypothetical protein
MTWRFSTIYPCAPASRSGQAAAHWAAIDTPVPAACEEIHSRLAKTASKHQGFMIRRRDMGYNQPVHPPARAPLVILVGSVDAWIFVTLPAHPVAATILAVAIGRARRCLPPAPISRITRRATSRSWVWTGLTSLSQIWTRRDQPAATPGRTLSVLPLNAPPDQWVQSAGRVRFEQRAGSHDTNLRIARQFHPRRQLTSVRPRCRSGRTPSTSSPPSTPGSQAHLITYNNSLALRP